MAECRTIMLEDAEGVPVFELIAHDLHGHTRHNKVWCPSIGGGPEFPNIKAIERHARENGLTLTKL